MSQSRKRRLIEEGLGESLESFLTRRFSAKGKVRCIAKEIGVDPATVRYYRDKYEIISKLYWKDKLGSGPAIYRKEEARPLNTRLKGKHMDVCLCRLCGDGCREREGVHGEGRCVVICSDFERRLREKVAT